MRGNRNLEFLNLSKMIRYSMCHTRYFVDIMSCWKHRHMVDVLVSCEEMSLLYQEVVSFILASLGGTSVDNVPNSVI